MGDPWIVNTSPLICLAKAGCLELLSRVAPRILVPREVGEEILAGPANDQARKAIEAGFGERLPATPIPPSIQAWSLGAGESAVLAAALLRPGSLAVIDDAQARMCGRLLGVPLIGTLGVVLRARHVRLIEQAGPIMRKLLAAGLRIDEGLVREALRQATGEDWE